MSFGAASAPSRPDRRPRLAAGRRRRLDRPPQAHPRGGAGRRGRAGPASCPTREEMAALEPSSRLYQEAGATFMTATLLARSDEDAPFATPVTFVLAGGRLVTLRYDELRAFTVFAERAPHERRRQRRGGPAGPAGRHRRAAGRRSWTTRATRWRRPRRHLRAAARPATSGRCSPAWPRPSR